MLVTNGFHEYGLPISLNSFMLSPDTVGKLSIKYMDVPDIVPDIADTTGDGKSLTMQMVVRNIYGYELDFSDLVTRTSIRDAEVTGLTDVIFSGKAFTPSAGKMTVTYGKNEKSTGYVVRYGLKSDMSDAKVVTVQGAGTLSMTFSSLKKGKTYYVQVRAYKLEDGVRYYSAYSTTKSIKITK